MSADPSHREPVVGFWATFWKVNLAALRAVASGAIAWWFWRFSDANGLSLLIFAAALFAIIAVKHAVIALVAVIRMIMRQRKWARYRQQGTNPKADRMASEEDLRAKGLIR